MPNRQMFIMRIALLAGVLAFGAFSLYRRTQVAIDPLQASRLLDGMRYALWGVSVAAVLAALFLRTRLDAATPQMRRNITLIGWSFGEGAALFGLAQHYAGAAASTGAIGVLTFVVVLMLLPVPREPVTAG